MSNSSNVKPRTGPVARAALCAAAVVFVAAGAAIPAGCNVAGPALLLAHGPPKLPREYQLDKEKKTVILVDDFDSRLPKRRLGTIIADKAQKDVAKKGLVKELISAESAMALARTETSEDRRTIPQIGRDVGADVVIWCGVEMFSLTADGQSFSPTARLRIKVIDVASDSRVWPAEERHYTLVVQPAPDTAEAPATTTALDKAQAELADFCGRAIAELFYEPETARAARLGRKAL